MTTSSYSNYVKPITEIKQKIAKNANRIGVMTIILPFLVIATIISALFLLLGGLNSIPILIIAILSFIGVAITRIIFLFLLSFEFDNLGDYYKKEIQSASEASTLIKISLVANLLGASFIGVILRIIGYYKIAETFKELRMNDLTDKQESRLLFYSSIGEILAGIVGFVSLAMFIPFIVMMGEYGIGYRDYTILNTPIIIIGIFVLLFTIVSIIKGIGFLRLKQDVLLIKETESSYVGYQPYQNAYSQPNKFVQYGNQREKDEMPSEKYTNKEKNFCINCGSQITLNSSFCPNCGEKIK